AHSAALDEYLSLLNQIRALLYFALSATLDGLKCDYAHCRAWQWKYQNLVVPQIVPCLLLVLTGTEAAHSQSLSGYLLHPYSTLYRCPKITSYCPVTN